MKRNTVIGAVVALLLLAYPITTWWTGKQVESHLTEQYKLLESVPFVKVVKRDFKGGFASSEETVTFEVFGDLFRQLEQQRKERADQAAQASTIPDAASNEANDAATDAPQEAVAAAPAAPVPSEPIKPFRFTVHSKIKHGPFAGGGFAAAVTDSELVFDDKTKQELAKVLGDKKPITAHTVFGFGGGGTSKVTSPAFATDIPGANGNNARMTWEGFSADVDFTRHMASYTMRGEAPKLEIQDAKGVHMVMSGLKLEGKQQRMFEDEPLLYSGTQKFSIAQVNFSGEGEQKKPVSLKDVVYDIDMPHSGDFADMIAKMGAASVLVDAVDYGPARYEISFKHLHARTVAKLYRAAMKMYGNPGAMQADPKAALAPLAEPAMELLKHNPEFRIDRISFKSPHGEAVLAGHVKLNDAKPEDFSNPMMMIAKLEAGADIALPEAFIAEMGAAKAQSPEEKEMAKQMFAAQLEAYTAQGYVKREAGLVKSIIAFKAGQLTVNGKPFNPMAMGGAPQHEADAHEMPSMDQMSSEEHDLPQQKN